MCGRFALALQANQVEQLDGYPALHIDQWVHRDRYVPRYNVAPRTHAPVIRRARPEEPALVMHSMRWGLVPHWSKAEPPTLNTINARSENLEEGGGMWGSVKGRKRCVVVAQGYYEWLKKGTQRVPHFMRHKDKRLMLFAGLYDSASLEGQPESLWTFTIVTTAASSSFAWLHDRQPVILTSQDALDRWLDTSSQTWDPKLSRLLDPHDDSDAPLECYAVPAEVGKVGVESPTFIEPVQKRRDGIEAMFMRQAKAKAKEAKAEAGSGKRKHESPSPSSPAPAAEVEGGASDTSVLPSRSSVKRAKVEAERDPIRVTVEPKKEKELIIDVDIVDADDDRAERDNSSDVEILPGPSSPQSGAKSRTKKNERDDTALSDSQQQQQQQQQQPSSPQQTESASKKKSNLAITGTPPRNKKKEGKKPTEPSSPSSKSTPKITSFFSKTTAA